LSWYCFNLVIQFQTPSANEKDPDSPTADTISLPLSPHSPYASNLHRSKTFSSPPTMQSITQKPSLKMVRKSVRWKWEMGAPSWGNTD